MLLPKTPLLPRTNEPGSLLFSNMHTLHLHQLLKK
jgi:hypothetical protein